MKEGTNKVLGVESQEMVNLGKTPQEEKAADIQVEQLAEQVEKANIEEEVKVTHGALTEVMKGWKGEGKVEQLPQAGNGDSLLCEEPPPCGGKRVLRLFG